MYKRYVKRLLDLVLSGAAIAVLAPVLLALVVAIKLDSPGPALFRQRRVGIRKTYFDIFKFRTMKQDAPKDVPTHLMGDPRQYLTGIGGFLRRTSLDELPQLFNIFMGDMSVIGPRPALWNQEDLIELRDRYGANDVLPGLSGWAQINGRDELPLEEKARLDGEYVRNMSFFFDLKCMLGTVSAVLTRRGVREDGSGLEDGE